MEGVTQETLDKFYGHLIQYGMNLAAAILILVVGKWVAKVVSNLLKRVLLKSKIDATLAVFAENICYFAILAFVGIAVLNKIGIETNSFLAVIGAAGLAIGLALQGSLSNFAAGVMMILFRPFKIGDVVEAGGAFGRVLEIQIFSTIIMTDDKKKIIIPNFKITADKIIIHPK